MATYDPVLASSSQFQAHSDARYDRGLRISWGGIIGGTALGWALFTLLSLIGAAIGLAKMDPYSSNPANGLGAGSGIFGIVVVLLSSFLGAYLAVKIAGDRRRGEALMHGAISWALSLFIGAMLALGAARTAAQSAATVASGPRAQARAERETNARRGSGPTPADRERASEAADAGAKTTGAAAGGAILGLVGSLLGGLSAARRRVSSEVRGGPRPRRRGEGDMPMETARHEETVVIPPRA